MVYIILFLPQTGHTGFRAVYASSVSEAGDGHSNDNLLSPQFLAVYDNDVKLLMTTCVAEVMTFKWQVGSILASRTNQLCSMNVKCLPWMDSCIWRCCLESCGDFRRQTLFGGSWSLGAGLEVMVDIPTSWVFIATWTQVQGAQLPHTATGSVTTGCILSNCKHR